MKRSLPFAVLIGLALTNGAQGAAAGTGIAEAPPAPIKVLFLGDQGHHRPADRAAQITPVLAGRGIDVTYTEKLGDLNPATLCYDALLIYANTTEISPVQEKALLDYVDRGGGFVPVHCALYCFLNSPKYIALVGAQFQRHGTGEFDTKIVDSSHPIMKGFVPFRTWDETYVHTKHNDKDRHILQTRAEGKTDEPWTWVRNSGKGRVFYTAYGHDTRTWQNPSFHDLIERGIRWASAQGEVYDSRGRVTAGLPPFTYDESTAEIPNYLPGRQWGTQGEAIRKMQKPLAPLSRSSIWSSRRASSRGCSRPSPRSTSPSVWPGTIADGSGSPRVPTIPTRSGATARDATGSPSSKTPTATAGPTRSRSLPRASIYRPASFVMTAA